MQHGPAVRRRKLGAELRALRTSAGLTSGEAARLAGWHQSKVSRIETGTSGVKPADVRLLLDVYGVADPQLRELLLMLSGSGDGDGRHHWWHAYRGVLPPTYRDFISLESQASAMRTLETTVIPGLLQTPEYARAVTEAALEDASEERLDALVEVRLARQDVLRATPPLELSAVLDEAVLRREVGGPGVMARQLDRLVEAARLPQVRLQVLPFSAGAQATTTAAISSPALVARDQRIPTRKRIHAALPPWTLAVQGRTGGAANADGDAPSAGASKKASISARRAKVSS